MEKLAEYNNLQIYKFNSDDIDRIEIQYFSSRIYDSFNKRVNLFPLFYSQLFIRSKSAFYSIFTYMRNLTDEIIIGLESLILLPKNDVNLQTIHTQIIFGLYLVFSTIQDALFCLPDLFLLENNDNYSSSSIDTEIMQKINRIRQSYQEKRRELEKIYLDKLNFEEEQQIAKELSILKEFKNMKFNNDNNYTFETYQNVMDVYSITEEIYMNNYLSMLEPLLNNLAKIATIIEENEYLIDIVKNNTPSSVNLLIAQINIYFPLFIKHYKILKEKGIIYEKESCLSWKGKTSCLAGYFAEIYKIYNSQNNIFYDSDKKEKRPWIVVEKVFKECDLKNHLINFNKNSDEFINIVNLLKLELVE